MTTTTTTTTTGATMTETECFAMGVARAEACEAFGLEPDADDPGAAHDLAWARAAGFEAAYRDGLASYGRHKAAARD